MPTRSLQMMLFAFACMPFLMWSIGLNAEDDEASKHSDVVPVVTSSIKPTEAARAELNAGAQKAGPDRAIAMQVDITSHGHPVLIMTRLAGIRLEPGPRKLEHLRLFLQARNKRSGEVTGLGQIYCVHGRTNHLTDVCIKNLPPGDYSIELEWSVNPWGIAVTGEGDNGNRGALFALELVGAESILELERQLRCEVGLLALKNDRFQEKLPSRIVQQILQDKEFRRILFHELLADEEFLAGLRKALSKPVGRKQTTPTPTSTSGSGEE